MTKGTTKVTEILVTEGKTLVTEGKTLVTEGKTLVTKGKTLVTDGKTLVTEGPCLSKKVNRLCKAYIMSCPQGLGKSGLRPPFF